MTWKPYLQLVRLPNVFTAAADSLAGWLLTMGTVRHPEHWLPLCLASMSIYAGGIVFNDYFDVEVDRVERPRRPLPSGRITRRVAVVLGSVFLVLGAFTAMLTGSLASSLVAMALILCVLGYDAGLSRWWIGPFLMGSCRGLNMLLGMTWAARLGGPWAWLAAASFATFVMGLTWISRSEAKGGEVAGPVFGWLLQNAGLVGLATTALNWPAASPRWAGLLVLLIVAVLVNKETGRAVREPVPAHLQRAVKMGVLSLVWLDVGLVTAARGPLPALAVAALWLPAFVMGRQIYST